MIVEMTDKLLLLLCKIKPDMDHTALRIYDDVVRWKARHLWPGESITVWTGPDITIDKVGRDTYVVSSTRDKALGTVTHTVMGTVTHTVKGIAGLKQLAKENDNQPWARDYLFPCEDRGEYCAKCLYCLNDTSEPDGLLAAVDDVVEGWLRYTDRFRPSCH